jgi:N4-gp56 family major capsid protein
MAVTVRNSNWGGSSGNVSELLVAYITGEIRVLEPDLQFARLGVQRDAPKGYDRVLFPQTNQLPVKINLAGPNPTSFGSALGAATGGSVFGAGASVMGDAGVAPGAPVSSSAGVAAITEGTNPTAVTWGATSYASGPYQYGILVQVSDLLVHNSAVEVVDSATFQVRNAMARLVDSAIQTVVMGGVNGVIYSGAKTSRSTIGAGDIITTTDVVRAVRNLRSANGAGVMPFDGKYYAAVCHPMVMADLMLNTQTGAWVDIGRYTSIDDLRDGKMHDFRGARFLESAYVNYFNSTVPVFPTALVGDQSFGWGYFQQPTPILVTTPDSNNPLNLYTSIGGKVTLGATRFEDTVGTQRIVRIESAASS